MNEILVTMRGNVVTDPRTVQLRDGTEVTSFRLAVTPRRFDRERGEWTDRETLWCTVNCWRHLAANVGASVCKGQPVVVNGRLSERTWSSDDRTGHSIEIEAETVGHDLVMGTSEFSRSSRSHLLVGDFRANTSFESEDLGESPAGVRGSEGVDGPAATAGPADVSGLPEAADGTSGEPLGGDAGFPGQVVPDGEVGGEPSATTEGQEPATMARTSTRRRTKATVS